jgi:phosphoenolpyruvate phosphomutase
MSNGNLSLQAQAFPSGSLRTVTDKATAFRQKFFSAVEPLRVIGAHDGLGAQLIERHGFDAIWASGLEISASHGVPDANILTLTQYLERAQEMNTASGLPVVADVDTGFGNACNVHYLVRQYESIGVAAVTIEDKLFPKVNSFVPGRQELASIPEFCGKLAAAKDAQQTAGFMVIARVEALIAGWGLEEALQRASAYAGAGADAILIHSKLRDASEIRAFLQAWKRRAPIVLVPTTYPDLRHEEMADLGVSMVIYANHGLRARVKATHDVLEVIEREKTTSSIEDRIAPLSEIFELQGMPILKEQELRYLRTQKTVQAIIPAAGSPPPAGDLADLLADRPVIMLDTEGKPLLERIVDSLNLAGVRDVTVVAGYRGDAVQLPGIEKRQLEDPPRTGLLYSIEQAAAKSDRSVLIHFGDVIVSHENLDSFIAWEDPIVAMVSPLLRTGRYENKQFDLVTLERPASAVERTLERHPRNKLIQIGKDLQQPHGEFVGLLLLNPEGVRIWRSAIADCTEWELHSFSLNDFLGRLLRNGVEITTFETRTGWAEVHSRLDYEQLCGLLRNR